MTGADGGAGTGRVHGRAGLPDGVAAAWGVRERPHKGPKPALSLARIVDAAVQVATPRAGRGLDGAGGGRARRGAHVAVPARGRQGRTAHADGGRGLGRSAGPAAPGEGWRAGLARWAWALRAGARRHPWVVRIPLNSLPIMPNEVGWFELALASMRDTGLTEARKASVIMLLAGYVRNLATTEADIAAAIQASGLTPAEWMSCVSRACWPGWPIRGGSRR